MTRTLIIAVSACLQLVACAADKPNIVWMFSDDPAELAAPH
jgi:hypothetical protein